MLSTGEEIRSPQRSSRSGPILAKMPCTIPLFHGVPISLEPYIAESSAWSQTLRRHRLPKGLGKILPPEVQVGHNWPLYGQRWPKLKMHVRDSKLSFK